jgi:phosphate uptake regulator
MHGRALDVLQQDVRQLRQEISTRFDALERSVAAILAAVSPGGP